MAHMVRKHQSDQNKDPRGVVGIHRGSRVISKVQPKIRIIHIFAPEVIQTDVANFRDLVQSLTGKPSSSSPTTTTTSTSSGSSQETKARRLEPLGPQSQTMDQLVSNNGYVEGFHESNYGYPYKLPVAGGLGGYPQDQDRVHGGGFLEVFDGENDYFMQGMGDFSMEGNHGDHRHHQFGEEFHPLAYRG